MLENEKLSYYFKTLYDITKERGSSDESISIIDGKKHFNKQIIKTFFRFEEKIN